VPEAVKYAALVIALMWISYGLVTTLVIVLGLGVYVSKLLVEGTLFAASFALQNLVVFADRRRPRQSAEARATDWDAYYRRAGLFTPLTRRITERVVVREVARATAGEPPDHIAEFGGGNSPILAAFRARYPAARLTAVDTNASSCWHRGCRGIRGLPRSRAASSRRLPTRSPPTSSSASDWSNISIRRGRRERSAPTSNMCVQAASC
jgi:hypothetical protein